MNLLFDQNISYRIIKRIEDVFPGSLSVRELGFDNPHDFDIWKFAKLNNYSIVTFDSDFIDLSNLKGFPPKNNLAQNRKHFYKEHCRKNPC